MAINPIDLNHAMTRTQDYTTMKHNEDMKGVVDQSNFHINMKKEVESKFTQVRKKDEAEYNQRKFDAKEKGDNEYYGNGEKKKKDSGKMQDKVTIKSVHHFDVTI